MNKTDRICPLLNMQPAEECSDPACLGAMCAWYVPLKPCSQDGRCAVTYLSDIASTVWAT